MYNYRIPKSYVTFSSPAVGKSWLFSSIMIASLEHYSKHTLLPVVLQTILGPQGFWVQGLVE